MKVTIKGVYVEGTPEEIASLLKIMGYWREKETGNVEYIRYSPQPTMPDPYLGYIWR